MEWTIIVLAVALPVVVLIAWGMWLAFATVIAKWHGPTGLEAVRHVADGFSPRDWALLIPRQMISSAFSALAALRDQKPVVPAVVPLDAALDAPTGVVE
jgi:hypothetical protein